MKNSEKLLLLIVFILLNLGAVFIISKFFNLAYGLTAGAIICSFAIIDVAKRRKAKKMEKEYNKVQQEKRKNNEEQRRIAEKKRKEGIKRQQRRMHEHNRYR